MTALVQETNPRMRAAAAVGRASHVRRLREWLDRTGNLIRYSYEASRAYERSCSTQERQAVLIRFLVDY